MKPCIGDVFRHKVGKHEEFIITRINGMGRLDVKCIKAGDWLLGSVYPNCNGVETWLRNNWELIPIKETRIKNILDQVDKL